MWAAAFSALNDLAFQLRCTSLPTDVLRQLRQLEAARSAVGDHGYLEHELVRLLSRCLECALAALAAGDPPPGVDETQWKLLARHLTKMIESGGRGSF